MRVCFVHCETPSSRPENRRVAEIMVASLRASMPHATLVQMSDPNTAPLAVDEVARKKVNYSEWVPWLSEFVSEMPGEFLFLDTDIVVQRDLSALLSTGADILITTRGPKRFENREMPFLLGVTAVKTPAIWAEIRDRTLAMPEKDDREWWGGQVALFDMYMDEQAGRGKWKFSVVPCDTYNYAPKAPSDTPKEAWVLHYKGKKRKAWMLDSWSHLVQEKVAA